MTEQNIEAIVVDLDETLISVNNDLCEQKCGCLRFTTNSGWLQIQKYTAHFRPGCQEFLDHCDRQGLKIIVFSAAGSEYVKTITNEIFSKRSIKPISILHRSHLTWVDSCYAKTFQKVEDETGILKHKLLAVDDCKDNYPGEHDRVIFVEPWIQAKQPVDNYLSTVIDEIAKKL